MNKINRIWIKNKITELPLIKVMEDLDRNQVVLAFNFGTSHITLHPMTNGTILRTHHDKNKPKGSWDDERASIAKNIMKWKDWEKHGQYYIHGPLIFAQDFQGNKHAAHVGGLGFDWRTLKIKQKYLKDQKIIMDIEDDIDFVDIYFSYKDSEPDYAYQNTFETILGNLHLNFCCYKKMREGSNEPYVLKIPIN